MARHGRFLLLASCLALLLAPLAGFAAEDDDEEHEAEYARPGLYLRASGQAVWTTSQQGYPAWLQFSWEPEFGLDATVGWRNSERIAIEIEFEWVTNTQGIGFGSWLIGVNGKYYVLEERIQPYIILGMNSMWTQVPNSPYSIYDWSFRNGIGVDYYLTEHWALSAESTFVWGVGDLWKNYFLTVGLGAMYRF